MLSLYSQSQKVATLSDVSKVKFETCRYKHFDDQLLARSFWKVRLRCNFMGLTSKSHKVATQANVRKIWGMQMGSVLLDICMF